MNITVQKLADNLEGKVTGQTDGLITHPAKIEEAQQGAVSFLANLKYEEFLYKTNATAVLVPTDLELKKEVNSAIIRVKDPYTAFVQVLNQFQQNLFTETGVHPTAYVDEKAVLGKDVYVGPNAVVLEGARIGDNSRIEANATISKFAKVGKDCQIFPNVSIYHFCELGDRVIIHSSTVIGSDGFGFAPDENGVYIKVPQVGNVVIGDDVEIGANTTIDRATLGSTLIGNGVKIDNLVQIAHNVVIDENTVIAAQAGISGSTKIGKNVVIGGQAGFVGHITVANNTKINAKSGISKSVKKEGQFLSGVPAFDWREELKSKLIFKNLPKLEKRIGDLEKKLEE